MTLVVQELKTSSYLEQIMTCNEDANVIAVRPHLLKFGAPSGSLQVQIYDSTGMTLIATSETISVASISSYAYFHGYIRFYINASLQKGLDYRFRLVGVSGYTFGISNFLGWCNGFDLKKYPVSFTPASVLEQPLDVEIWNKREA